MYTKIKIILFYNNKSKNKSTSTVKFKNISVCVFIYSCVNFIIFCKFSIAYVFSVLNICESILRHLIPQIAIDLQLFVCLGLTTLKSSG